MGDGLRNWAGNIEYGAGRVHRPRSVEQVRELVRGAHKVRAVGSRHSFNAIAATAADLVSLADLDRLIEIDSAARTVTVDGGITYGQLCGTLEEHGLALRNLASLPHITVVGACATATHGSGDKNGNLATAVAGLEFVSADGNLVAFMRGDDGFDGAVVSLGALGLVTRVTLDVVPTFKVRQDVYLDLPFARLVEAFDDLTSSAYSVSFFTEWRDDRVNQVWMKHLAGAPASQGPDLLGARLADRKWHPIAEMDATPCTDQLGTPDAWHRRLTHFRIDVPPSAAGAELQSEYFMARRHARDALRALKQIQARIAPPLLVSEIRTMAADMLWMSMAHGRDTVAFHFTWKPDWPVVRDVLPELEAALAPFNPRPHWGKLFAMPAAEVQSRYQRLGDFRALLERHDPSGKFRNGFVDEYIFG